MSNARNVALQGCFRAFSIAGIPFYFYYNFPLFALVVLVVARQGDVAAAVGFIAGYAVTLFAHEGAHAAAARYFGCKVFSIRIGMSGGLCRFESTRDVRKLAWVFVAGVLAQAVLLLGMLFWLAVFGVPQGGMGYGLVLSLVVYNAAILVLSIIPRKPEFGIPSDGYQLRQLYLHAYKGAPHPYPPLTFVPPEQSPVFPPETTLLSVAELVPQGFALGIEIFNDHSTPMDFVLTTLARHVAQDEGDALAMMAKIHNMGGLLLPLPRMELAEQAAALITAHAREQGHSFTCRAVAVGNAASAI